MTWVTDVDEEAPLSRNVVPPGEMPSDATRTTLVNGSTGQAVKVMNPLHVHVVKVVSSDQVLPSAGRSTSRKQVSQQIFAARVLACQRRITRVAAFVVLLCLIYGIWFVACMPYTTTAETREYNPLSGLLIQLQDCDLVFQSGERATVEYRAWGRIARYAFTRDLSNPDRSDLSSAVLAGNHMGCDHAAWHSSCATMCAVIVSVPSAASESASFRIEQVPSAETASNAVNRPYVTVLPGTVIHSLSIGNWYAPASTLSLRGSHATIGHVGAEMDHGRVWLANCTLGDVALTSFKSASAYLLDVATGATWVVVHDKITASHPLHFGSRTDRQ